MPHLDDDTLSLLALGEDAAADHDHLASCPVCHGRLLELREVADLGRSLERAEVDPPPPPPAVWDAIAAEVAASSSTAAPDGVSPPSPEDVAAPGSDRGRSVRGVVVAALAIAAVVIALGVFAVVALTDDSSTVVESAALAPLDDGAGLGRAEVVVDGDRRELRVQTSGLPRRDGDYYELWLLDDDVTQLVSLGVLDPDRPGSFRVPDGLDLSRLRVVDVSVEPLDGVPTHSGDSVLRGTLRA